MTSSDSDIGAKIKNFDPFSVIKTNIKSAACDTFTVNQNYELLNDNDSDVLSAKLLVQGC